MHEVEPLTLSIVACHYHHRRTKDDAKDADHVNEGAENKTNSFMPLTIWSFQCFSLLVSILLSLCLGTKIVWLRMAHACMKVTLPKSQVFSHLYS